ncbi:ABC transporter ATP-binding protein [Chitinophaga sp. 212800010-3]|uniref:ABC transporter ATP-binding protein n=1 Tax=unclassified Chitinophaga TaxID=2619133 RepID=UPI002DE9B313|nr:Lipoprotein-releasing system ATP-binding protein LolD [Chitinophaga sp. 212800010-3]
MNLIEVRHINKYFYQPAEMQVLKDISFDIEKGKFVSITGKSGSGKSTLLYLLSTMDTTFDGSIRINNEEMRGKSNRWLADFRNHHIGFVFQFHYLLPEFTALRNVMLPALKQGKYRSDEIEQQALDLLQLLGVGDQAGKRASLLSGGQQQRVAIARALINEPLIIMGDEPTGNLDSHNAALVFDLFKKLSAEKGQTILTVTHDEDFARRSDHIIHMVDGEIIA